MFLKLDKVNRISALTVDEALEGVPLDVDLHRGRMVLVKRAEADIAGALFDDLVRPEFGGDHIFDGGFRGDFGKDIIASRRLTHPFTSPDSCLRKNRHKSEDLRS